MNRLRDLLESKHEDWLIHPSMTNQANEFTRDVQRHGKNAMCFWLGEATGLNGIKIIPELCELPFDVCWFEMSYTLLEKTLIAGLLTIQMPTVTRLIGFYRYTGIWSMAFAAELEKFNAGEFVLIPNEDGAFIQINEMRAAIARFLSAMHLAERTPVQECT